MCGNVVKVGCPECGHENLITQALRKQLDYIYCSSCAERIEFEDKGHPAKRRHTKGAARNA